MVLDDYYIIDLTSEQMNCTKYNAQKNDFLSSIIIQEWPYKGREKEKEFLYEVISFILVNNLKMTYAMINEIFFCKAKNLKLSASNLI